MDGSKTPAFARLTSVLRDSENDVLGKLFSSEAVVSIVLNGLDALQKLVVFRLVPLKEAAPWPPLVAWVSGNQTLLKGTVTTLRRLKIIQLIQPTQSGSSISGTGPTPVGKSVKYGLHGVLKSTIVCMIHANALRQSRFSCFQYLSSEEELRIETPDASMLLTFAQRQWGALLKWLFSVSVKTAAAPKLTISAQRPGPVLEEVLNYTRLIEPPTVGPDSSEKPRISRKAFQWLLSDLSTQLSNIIFSHFIGPEGSEINARLITIVCHIAHSKIGQPLVLNRQITPEEDKFISLCKDVGLVIVSMLNISQETQRVIHTTPLSRILSCDPSTDSADLWTLSQAFAERSYQDWQEAGAPRKFILPKNRYHLSCLARSRAIKPPNYSEYEVDCFPASNTVEERPEGDIFNSPGFEIQNARRATPSDKYRGIVVESNFRVFAYHPDELELSVLSNLCEIKVLCPSLIVGVLTRDSIMNAFSDGLTADQMIRFFTSHAHQSVIRRAAGKIMKGQLQNATPAVAGGLPENVANQLELWEAQRSSLTMKEACLFEFSDDQELNAFPQLLARAKLSNAVLCHTAISAEECQVGSAEFTLWKANLLKRIRTVGRTSGTTVGQSLDGWFANGAIIVISSNHKVDFARHLKQARTARRLAVPLVVGD